jgi:hypothetical protein
VDGNGHFRVLEGFNNGTTATSNFLSFDPKIDPWIREKDLVAEF